MGFNTIFRTEFILNLLELNHTVEIYTKCHFLAKLLNLNLILGRDKLHALGTISYFKNKSITWQKGSISIQPHNCMAKQYFVIKEKRPV